MTGCESGREDMIANQHLRESFSNIGNAMTPIEGMIGFVTIVELLGGVIPPSKQIGALAMLEVVRRTFRHFGSSLQS